LGGTSSRRTLYCAARILFSGERALLSAGRMCFSELISAVRMTPAWGGDGGWVGQTKYWHWFWF